MNGPSRFLKPGLLLTLFFLLLTTVYLSAAFDIHARFSGDGEIGPRSIPILAASCMYVALCVVLVQEWRTPAEAPAQTTAPNESHGLWRPLGVVAATAGYILLFRPMGYTVSTLAFVAALFIVFDFQTRRPVRFALFAVAVTAVFYGLFAGVFGVRLPALTEGWP